jgi:hypothetical protein
MIVSSMYNEQWLLNRCKSNLSSFEEFMFCTRCSSDAWPAYAVLFEGAAHYKRAPRQSRSCSVTILSDETIDILFLHGKCQQIEHHAQPDHEVW